MTNKKEFGKEFNNLADTSHINTLELTNIETKQKHVIENIPGKQASVKILAGIATDNKITTKEAEIGLALYGDYTAEENQLPNSHPNIRLLLNIIENDETWTTTYT